jgi:PAS domain S-box-containing protein
LQLSSPGTDRVFQVRSFGITMPNGTVAKMGVLKDVTRRRQLQEEVKEFAARHQAVEDAADRAKLGIFIIQNHEGLEARFRYANEAFARTTGYSPEELLALSVADLVHPSDLEATMDRYRRRQSGEILDQVFEIKIIRKDGVTITASYSVALTPYEGKMATVGFLRDVTEKQRVRKALWQSQRLASIGRLAAEIAHEINNPLTSALTFSKLAQRIVTEEPFTGSRLPELRQYISYLDAEASRCAGIAKGLLDFSRQGEIDIKENDLKEILDKTIDIVRHRSQLAQIELETSYDPKVPHVVCDFRRLQQALLNIMWNAIEAMPDGGLLRVATSFAEGQQVVTIEITDTGIGISEDHLERVFEPFFTTKDEAKGVGLGLAVAYGIIRQHQGQLSAQSQQGEGTRFTIQLPARHPPLSCGHLSWLRPAAATLEKSLHLGEGDEVLRKPKQGFEAPIAGWLRDWVAERDAHALLPALTRNAQWLACVRVAPSPAK